MLWYLLRTWHGREEDLAGEIRRTVPPYLYKEVFVICNQRVWRRQGRSIGRLEPLFKGCVFLTCEKTEPLFRRLEQVPAISRLIATGSLSVFPLREEDARFLDQISGKDHVIRLSHVLYEEGKEDGPCIYKISGPLEDCLDYVEKFQFGKRFVKLSKRLWGEDLAIYLGILLKEDLARKILYENITVSVEMAERYALMKIQKDSKGKWIKYRIS